jgi:hypothetical protein
MQNCLDIVKFENFTFLLSNQKYAHIQW